MAGDDAVICAGFHSRNDDWMLPHKLRVLSAVADRIVVLLDHSPQSAAICRRFPKVEVHHWQECSRGPEIESGHRACDEGAMRQWVWDECARSAPKWIVLGDTDEVPTPGLRRFLAEADDTVDVWYADWVNLIGDAGHAIGGIACPWSFQNRKTNKKGQIARWRPKGQYRYRQARVHVRLEPSPLHESSTVYNPHHRLGPAMVHYKWADLTRWRTCAESALPQWTPWPPADAQVVNVSRKMLWQWDADALLASLPDPVAVVGNGPMQGQGAKIDACATIIRLNNFRIAGHEEDVGRRCDAWCTNCWDDVVRRPWTGDLFTVTTDVEQYDRNSSWLGTFPHLAIPRKSWVDAARAFKPDNPSTGLTLLARLAHHGKRVRAFGFDGMRSGHYWNAQHQHDHREESRPLAMLQAAGVEFAQ